MQTECKPNAMQCKPNAKAMQKYTENGRTAHTQTNNNQSKVFVSLSKRSGLNGFYYPQKS